MSSFERRGFADQLSIETPEQVALEFPVAGVGSRFAALLLDHGIQFGVVLLLLIGVGVVNALHPGAVVLAGKWFLAGAGFLLFLMVWGYFSLFEAFWHGQTPGKRALKLRVIKDTGRQITLFEALARNLLRVVDYLPSLYLVGVVTMLTNKRNKRLGDMAAGTLVVHERVDAQPLLWAGMHRPAQGMFNVAQPMVEEHRFSSRFTEEGGLFPVDALGRLSGQDVELVEAFFARAIDLPLDARAAMAERIVGQMTAKMGVAMPERSPERALEALALQLRGPGRRSLSR